MISAPFFPLLKRDGSLVLVGAPPHPVPIPAFALIPQRKRLAGSCTGGIRETQEMLDFCAGHGIVSDVEVIPIQQINEAYERTISARCAVPLCHRYGQPVTGLLPPRASPRLPQAHGLPPGLPPRGRRRRNLPKIS